VTATELVLHHRYRRNLAFDLSDNGNHGTLTGAHDEPSGPNAGTLRFSGGNDRVIVAKSATTDRLREFHVKVRFNANGTAPVRYNLVEAELCFALFIESGWRIGATFLANDSAPGGAATSGWHGVFTAPGSVTPGRWHTVDYLHDGVSHARVFLDGTLIGERWDLVGPLQPLGPQGTYIGYWPGNDSRYTFRGNIAEVLVWREGPQDEVSKGLDDCCVDRTWLDTRVEEARRAGWDADRALATIADLTGALRHAAAKVRGGDQARTERTADATRRAMAAMRNGHGDAFRDALSDLQLEINTGLSPDVRDHLANEVLGAMQASPLGVWLRDDERRMPFLAAALEASCLDKVAPPIRDDRPRPPRPPKPVRVPSGDPDTDGDLPPWAQGQPQPAPDEPSEPRPPDRPPIDPLRPPPDRPPIDPLRPPPDRPPVQPPVGPLRPPRPPGPVGPGPDDHGTDDHGTDGSDGDTNPDTHTEGDSDDLA
jgi:Concanavalin A-like lectin/glucanases superfamily